MATRTFVDRPFQDLDVPDLLDTRTDSEVLGAIGLVEPSEETESDDRLSPARGILIALLLCTPFWLAVFWLLS
ncbi:MAG TPA: hypothetical protein VFS23_36940 [Vicinamibacterales bacterium]|nr:hypothetical protein [Vicinamibacterales bacterium]